MNELSALALADLAGVTKSEVQRLVDLGVLVARDGVGPFLDTDVQKLRLAKACEQAGLLRRAGVGAAQGVRPSGAAAGGLPAERLTPAPAWQVGSLRESTDTPMRQHPTGSGPTREVERPRPLAGAAFGGSLSLTWLPPTVMLTSVVIVAKRGLAAGH